MCVYRYAIMGDWDGVGVYHLYAVGEFTGYYEYIEAIHAVTNL